MSEGAKYTLYELPRKLEQMQVGDTFKIKGQRFYWEFYDYDAGHYWLRNTISKQRILIEKD